MNAPAAATKVVQSSQWWYSNETARCAALNDVSYLLEAWATWPHMRPVETVSVIEAASFINALDALGFRIGVDPTGASTTPAGTTRENFPTSILIPKGTPLQTGNADTVIDEAFVTALLGSVSCTSPQCLRTDAATARTLLATFLAALGSDIPDNAADIYRLVRSAHLVVCPSKSASTHARSTVEV
jgi:hypothetical protein